MSEKQKSWWSDARLAPLPSYIAHHDSAVDVLQVAEMLLLVPALRGGGGPLHRYHGYGLSSLAFGATCEALAGALPMDARRIYVNYSKRGLVTDVQWAWPAGAAAIRLTGRTRTGDEAHLAVTLVTTDEEVHKRVVAVASEALSRSKPSDVFVLANDGDGLALRRIGNSAVALVRDNYDGAIVEAFDHVIEDIGAQTPCGRLTLISGPAGTGKSFLIRGILHGLSATKTKVRTILVPPSIARELSSPTLLPALLGGGSGGRHSLHKAGQPTLLLFEDADECLAPRMSDNVASVANLLSFGDGMLGEMLNIRLVATTNQPKHDIDPALLRPGRLCRKMVVGELAAIQANAVLQRLTGANGRHFETDVSLAQVYSEARRFGMIQAESRPDKAENDDDLDEYDDDD